MNGCAWVRGGCCDFGRRDVESKDTMNNDWLSCLAARRTLWFWIRSMDGVCVVVVLCNNKEKREGKGERPTGFGNKYIGEHQWTVALWYLELWVAERRRQSRLRLVSDQGKELSQLLLQVSLFVKNIAQLLSPASWGDCWQTAARAALLSL